MSNYFSRVLPFLLIFHIILAYCADQRLQVYIVYLGEHSGTKNFQEIEDFHRSYLHSVKGNSKEEAKDCLIYSYKNVINGFSALLSPEEAAKISVLFAMASPSMSGDDVSRTPLENTPSGPLCKRRGRGPTRGKRIEKIVAACGHKLKVEFNTLNGRAVGPNASGWANEMGFIVRSMAPLAAKQWKEIDHAYKIPMIDRLKEKFEFETNKLIEDSIDQSMKKMWSEYRCKLHKYFVSVGGNEDVGLAKRSKPETVVEHSDWVFLCDHFGCDAMKKRSEVNKKNRANRVRVTVHGSKSFAAHAHEMRDPETKKLPGHIEFFREMHCSKRRGWTTEEAEKSYKQMLELQQNSVIEPDQDSMPLTENRICNQVLGKRFGYFDPHKHMSKKMRLEDGVVASSENAILRTEVQDLREELKNVKELLGRIPKEILQPMQNDTPPTSSSNGDM